ncbi:MAG: Glu-tRNA(Gln) amidotransferase subunit GatE [Bacteroidales bacterium]|jgi:glutamyl-tRNA(Gln) amidotransferase subunit E|nr:Glu-tRNA(Gln) amidotransferase subunit GatE [Bacteroidales bacterium]MDY0086383.1 Glu-tRNA(Gln) amidotransferase subunit GatE [Bacteroidales bacterium]
MIKPFDAKAHYEQTRQQAGYVPRKQATQQTYDRIGFMSGLEVHQQLLTDKKLFCHCPAGVFNHSNDYDAEIIRHMRPTLSELGEYDGTALMEFKTRKEIVYRIKNPTACTYEVDDTPPFPINRQALDIAIEISLLSKLNVVGEVHITRKQYLDGSIPTGFQRTAIIGVEGEIPLPHKKIRLIQLSIEEDSCREISDIGHTRVYKTDRLGMPLIETVTYPECMNPDEVKQACDYIRFLNRSTGKVRTGMGAGRQDVNVSCKGGTRVEIKGVAHTKWIPELTHNEAFRQWSLLLLRDQLLKQIEEPKSWKIKNKSILAADIPEANGLIRHAEANGNWFQLICLPGFKGALSHFTQPGQSFVNELSDRLKVIACIEKPHLLHSEMIEPGLTFENWEKLGALVKAGQEDALLLIWGPEEDIATALETIEERCKMALEGIPQETRKSLPDGTTIFERVLPGADRMYPDTDSAPIPLEDTQIENLRSQLPEEVIDHYHQLQAWGVPEDTYTYIFSKNLFPLIRDLTEKLQVPARYAGTFIGHTLKHAMGQHKNSAFKYRTVYHLFDFLKQKGLEYRLAEKMIYELAAHPRMEFESVLNSMKFKSLPEAEIISKLPFIAGKFNPRKKGKPEDRSNWIMGQLRNTATGNINLTELAKTVKSL